jgi:hypothetical protein
MRQLRAFALGGAVAAAAVVAVGARLHRGWGSTPEERVGPLPGDDLIPNPKFRSTRAITIDARPEAVWPWLVQMGAGRGGWYSYDTLAGLFSGPPTVSATSIVEPLQDLRVGDPVDLVDRMVFSVAELIPGEAMVLLADENQKPLQPWTKSWTFALKPVPGGATRLLVREVSAWDSALVGTATAFTGWLWFLATRRQLLNLKTLVETD